MNASLSIVAVLSLSIFAGCASTEEDSAGGGSAVSAPEGWRVTLSTRSIHKDQSLCTTQGTELFVVTGTSTAATSSINSALSANSKAILSADCKTQEAHLKSTQKATINTGGYLSIEEQGKVWVGGNENEGETFVHGYNFNIQTGKKVFLKDVLTKTGLKDAIDACDESLRILRGPVEEAPDTGFREACSDALLGEATAPSNFVIKKEGLLLRPALNDAYAALADIGAIIEWSVIEKKLTSTGMAVREAAR